MRVSLFSASLLVSSLSVGCGSGEGELGSTESRVVTSIDQDGLDVQVLQAWTPGTVYPVTGSPTTWSAGEHDVDLDAKGTGCTGIGGHSETTDYVTDRFDCEAKFVNAMKFPTAPLPSPQLDSVTVDLTRLKSDLSYVYPDPDFCKILEVRVVVKDTAWNASTFAGVGFHTSRESRFFYKDALHVVGRTKLKSGELASVLRFTGIYACVSSAHMSTSGAMYQTFEFKPYARYDIATNADVQQYRVWEAVSDNFRVGRSFPGSEPIVDSSGFDRQSDLLMP
jgi:hypothetical protein